MAHLQKSIATLRVFGDSLIPNEVTRLLGGEATEATKKGELIRRPSGDFIAKHGSWRLKAPECEPENLDHQVSWLLGQLTDNLEVWQVLGKEFKIDLFCGLFMGSSNEGFSLAAATMVALGARGIEIGFDLYDPSE